MKNKNQKNHLTDSSSNMGLTTRKLQSQIITGEPPHYFEVRNLDGGRYVHCGSEEDAKAACERYPGFTYHKIYLPATPKTVDVPHVRLAPDFELPAQQILPESELQPFEV
jgi:hypothetical protein